MSEGIVGILGGMGPEATLNLFKKITLNTVASKDQDHLRVIIYSNPKIPDRTLAILGGGENPIKQMTDSLKSLEKAGADFAVIPCVTAHYFINELRRGISMPLVSILDEVAREIEMRHPGLRQIGLISTSGTIKSGLFQDRLEEIGVKVLVPLSEDQENLVMSAIYGERGIKAGFLNSENKEKIVKTSMKLIERGAQGIIGGCTEVSLVVQQSDLDVLFLDCLDVLAVAAVRIAKNW